MKKRILEKMLSFSSEYFFLILTPIISTGKYDFKQDGYNMAFSFLTQELAIDLGTANTVIFQNDQIVLDEPSIVAIDNNTGKCIALGQKAKLMHERVNPGIKTIRPLRDGVIADFNAAEMMIRGFIKQVNSKHRSLFNPNLRIVVGIPSGSTEVEIRAVRDSSEHAGGRDVFLIYEPMAAALGIGLDVEAPKGNMVVDIGGGTTEIAVISLGGIVEQESIRTAGDVFTSDIQYYLRQQHNIKVGEITAEKIKIAVGAVIPELGRQLELIDQNEFKFCWIVDFPMFELDDETGEIIFSHNPFSMPQGGMEALEKKDPLDILAYQYDIVCNGIELSSGAIRNHRPEIMYKAFEIAGYEKSTVDEKFGGMINAFKLGAPPHGGIAPGVDRTVMMLADEPNIREVIAFPFNQQAQDLMMNAPAEVSIKQLRELHLQLALPKKPQEKKED